MDVLPVVEVVLVMAVALVLLVVDVVLGVVEVVLVMAVALELLVVDVVLVVGLCAGCGCYAGCLSTTIGAGWWKIIRNTNPVCQLPYCFRYI